MIIIRSTDAETRHMENNIDAKITTKGMSSSRQQTSPRTRQFRRARQFRAMVVSVMARVAVFNRKTSMIVTQREEERTRGRTEGERAGVDGRGEAGND